jgi:hypothetical protein
MADPTAREILAVKAEVLRGNLSYGAQLDRASAWTAACREICKLRTGLKEHGDRIETALGNCMHEYGDDPEGQAALEWIKEFADG